MDGQRCPRGLADKDACPLAVFALAVFFKTPLTSIDPLIKHVQTFFVQYLRYVVLQILYIVLFLTCAGKQAWIGCGLHVPSAMSSFPKSEWCTCEGSTNEYPPRAGTGKASS
ncbi:unnamed protein product [Kuraishia capsulata CBS 1993]|uniref:Uncharacterized protein n=1 Tax=Kuraishia capsulata CBS 1993 TaxID=1382522 RepID=W6MU26_9ASCO|nr:uncharacterized protein KUCA_T00006018001 [Kuraishia capsulata CBS 1993]CDK30023.1 unnamed protein product [Kuraishia capsulata CBS 1993]